MTEPRPGHWRLRSSRVRWACLIALAALTLCLALTRSESGGAQEPAGLFRDNIAVSIEPGANARYNYVVVHTWDNGTWSGCTQPVLGELVSFDISTPSGIIVPDENSVAGALLGTWTSKAADVITFDTDGAFSNLTVQPLRSEGECQAWIHVRDDLLDYISIEVTVYDPAGTYTTSMLINDYTPTPSPTPNPTPTPTSNPTPKPVTPAPVTQAPVTQPPTKTGSPTPVGATPSASASSDPSPSLSPNRSATPAPKLGPGQGPTNFEFPDSTTGVNWLGVALAVMALPLVAFAVIVLVTRRMRSPN